MAYNPYPAYQPSGVAWLPLMPSGWTSARLRNLVKVNPTRSETNGLADETPVSFVPMEAVGEYGGLKLGQVRPLGGGNGYTYFREGDVLVAKITPCFENGKGAIAENLENGIGLGTTELHVLRPSPVLDRRYLFYLTISHAFRDIGASCMYGAGGQKRVPPDFVSNFRHPIPPLDEQRTIVAFLDHETARIDALIEKKQRQIELLQEKRTAVVTRAVTKGLNPNVKMKDSSVRWLSDIPEHWEVHRVKRLAQMESGHTPDRKVEAYWRDCTIPWVSLNDTSYLRDHDYIRDTAYRINELGLQHSSARLLPAGAVVFTRDATIGLAAITERTMAVSQHIIAWLCKPCLLPAYLLHVFYAMSQELERLTMGSTIKTLGMPDVLELVTPLPPLNEQRRIVGHVVQRKAAVDEAIKSISRSIEVLREYRAALISAVVTGKVDVRGEISA